MKQALIHGEKEHLLRIMLAMYAIQSYTEEHVLIQMPNFHKKRIMLTRHLFILATVTITTQTLTAVEQKKEKKQEIAVSDYQSIAADIACIISHKKRLEVSLLQLFSLSTERHRDNAHKLMTLDLSRSALGHMRSTISLIDRKHYAFMAQMNPYSARELRNRFTTLYNVFDSLQKAARRNAELLETEDYNRQALYLKHDAQNILIYVQELIRMQHPQLQR